MKERTKAQIATRRWVVLGSLLGGPYLYLMAHSMGSVPTDKNAPYAIWIGSIHTWPHWIRNGTPFLDLPLTCACLGAAFWCMLNYLTREDVYECSGIRFALNMSAGAALGMGVLLATIMIPMSGWFLGLDIFVTIAAFMFLLGMAISVVVKCLMLLGRVHWNFTPIKQGWKWCVVRPPLRQCAQVGRTVRQYMAGEPFLGAKKLED